MSWIPAVRGRDWLLVVGLALLAAWEVPRRVDEGGDPVWLAGSTLCLLAALPWLRAAPLPTLTITATIFAAYPLRDGSPELLVHALVLLVALYAAAVSEEPAPAAVALAIGVVAGFVRASLLAEYDVASAAVNAAWALPPWLMGRFVRQRDRRAAAAETVARDALQLAALAEGRAAEAERQRIARELHDVVAHAVTVMVVQARGGRHSLEEDREAAREAFVAVEESGRQALSELRRLLTVLPDGDGVADRVPDPLPGLASAGRLVERMRAAGLDVRLTCAGTGPDLPPAADFSAYRVLQEALTNALRYSGAGTTEVHLRRHPHGLEIEVRNPLGGQQHHGAGTGLIGARERVSAFGGSLQAGREDETFVLRAALPSGATEAPAAVTT